MVAGKRGSETMDYIKIKFCSDIDQKGSKFEKNIEEMFQSMNPTFRLSRRSWKPLMDIYETPDEIFILAEIAGVHKDDLEVEINSKAVRIFGKRIGVPPECNAKYRLAEIQYGPFERVLFLPSLIDTDQVSASYSDGLLKVKLVKQQQNVSRTIPIQNG